MIFIQAIKQYRYQLLTLVGLIGIVYAGIIRDMALDWLGDDNYSHGFLVPVIAGYFLYRAWPSTKDSPVAPSNSGLAVILCALALLLVAWLGTEYFTMRSSLVLLLAGVVLFCFGRPALAALALPLGYLLFMVPIPYIIYDAAAFPLKLFVTQVSVASLKALGVIVLREGNIIMFPEITLEVADACSGLRSLMSLFALSTAYAFLVDTTPVRRVLIIASALPIALACNALRVIATGLLAHYWDPRAAEGFFHEFAGLFVFGLAMVLLLAWGEAVRRFRR